MRTEFNRKKGEIVSLSKFAEILGVHRSSVSKAINSRRLSKSIVTENGKKLVHVFSGCVEWNQNKEHAKDRAVPESEDVQNSKARREYYRSMQAKQDYEVQTGLLVQVDEVAQIGAGICLKARQYLENSRDRDCYQIPKISSDFEARKFLKKRDDGFLNQIAGLKNVAKDVADEANTIQTEGDLDEE